MQPRCRAARYAATPITSLALVATRAASADDERDRVIPGDDPADDADPAQLDRAGQIEAPADIREIAAAERSELPRLVERGDLQGFLHCHTKYSDGSNTIEELALACKAAGYQWIGITDQGQAPD